MSERMHPCPLSIDILGDAFVDVLCYLEGDLPAAGGDARLHRPVESMAGGSAVNTATHLQNLWNFFSDNVFSASLKLFTVVNPNDNYGSLLLDHAEQHTIPIVNCHKDASTSATGHCIVVVAQGERSFLTHPGCMDEFEPADIPDDRLLGRDCNSLDGVGRPHHHAHVHIAGYYNLQGFWNGNLEQELVVWRRRQPSLTVSLVPQYDATGAWDGQLLQLLPMVDFLVLNELEANCMVQSNKIGENTEDNTILEQWARFFALASSSTCVVVTRGALGAVAMRDGIVLVEQPAIEVDAVDPTGAGDGFSAGFVYGIWKELYTTNRLDTSQRPSWPVEAIQQGLIWGCATAGCGVMSYGASTPSPPDEIESRVGQLILNKAAKVV